MRIPAGLVPPRVARLMTPEDRKDLGVLLPAEVEAKQCAREEKELQRLCEHELGRRGIWHLHLHNAKRNKIGVPDLIFAVDGTPFGVELKAADGRLTEGQRVTLGDMRRNGWTTAVVRSFEEFATLVGSLDASLSTERERA